MSVNTPTPKAVHSAAPIPADMVEWSTGPKGACFGPSGGAPRFRVSKLEVPAFLPWSGYPTATPRRVGTLLRRSLVALKRYKRHPGDRGRWRAGDLSPAVEGIGETEHWGGVLNLDLGEPLSGSAAHPLGRRVRGQ